MRKLQKTYKKQTNYLVSRKSQSHPNEVDEISQQSVFESEAFSVQWKPTSNLTFFFFLSLMSVFMFAVYTQCGFSSVKRIAISTVTLQIYKISSCFLSI